VLFFSRSCAQTSRESKSIEVAEKRTKDASGQQAQSVSTTETAASGWEVGKQGGQTE